MGEFYLGGYSSGALYLLRYVALGPEESLIGTDVGEETFALVEEVQNYVVSHVGVVHVQTGGANLYHEKTVLCLVYLVKGPHGAQKENVLLVPPYLCAGLGEDQNHPFSGQTVPELVGGPHGVLAATQGVPYSASRGCVHLETAS